MLKNRAIFVQIAIFVIACLVVNGAQAKDGIPAPLPDYEEGETFIFSNKRVEHVEKIEGDLITFSSRKGRHYTRQRNIVLPIIQWQLAGKSGQRTLHGDVNELWPLHVGNQIRFRVLTTVRDDKKQHETRRVELWSCRVPAQENIHVLAGEFASYRIVCDHYSGESMRVLRRYTWNYSPAVEHYVRREVKNFITGDRYQYELASTLRPEQSNSLRIKAELDRLDSL
ncbi:MAG: hypothetical protein L3J62_01390 [Gammaproteobacteria bacterium]|nr:hypothetical protein [Gammaproteobacteria bacterium]MCF6229439.1 hypothetical protein [Gammaproteobacteria bacterium]